jgi:bifunctional DNase/RNase
VEGKEVNVDSRPSDAIALSVRAHVPILVHNSVMDEAGIVPEQDVSDESEAIEQGEPAPLSEESTERLSVFEDFLEKLEFDKSDDEDKPDDAEGPSDKPKKK